MPLALLARAEPPSMRLASLSVAVISACERMTLLFAALHESASGTFQTWRDVRPESAFGGKAEVGFRGGQVRWDPTRTWP
jgi:hypothetical protein